MSATERYRIILSKRVASDLKSIFGHVATDSPANAPGLVSKILDAIASLRIFPHRNVIEGQSPRRQATAKTILNAPLGKVS